MLECFFYTYDKKVNYQFAGTKNITSKKYDLISKICYRKRIKKKKKKKKKI